LALFRHQLNHLQKEFSFIPEVGNNIESKDFPETTLGSPSSESTNPDGNTDVRPHNLPKLVRLEHDGIRVEIYDRS